MSNTEKLEAFSTSVLKGHAVPHDLAKMLEMQWTRVEKEGFYVDPLQGLTSRLIDVGATFDLLDHSYLSEKDRASADIMANVHAIDKVAAMISFVAEDDDSRLYGYWHGPENTPASEAPIVTLNSEGQFDLTTGRSLAEALMAAWIFEEDQFTQFKNWFAQYGVEISATSLNDFADPVATVKPQDLHGRFYDELTGKGTAQES